MNRKANTTTATISLGAREYDPKLGRFLSVDPVIDPFDPQQMNGYNYANNSPISFEDADGLWPNWRGIVKKARTGFKKAWGSAQVVRSAWGTARTTTRWAWGQTKKWASRSTWGTARPTWRKPARTSGRQFKALGPLAGPIVGAVIVGVKVGAKQYAKSQAKKKAKKKANERKKQNTAKYADEALSGVDEVLKGLSKGRSAGVRTVRSGAELDEVYGRLARGGKPLYVPRYKGSWVERSDGVRVGLRGTSKSGGRTIDIRYPNGTTGKVHIE